jgi:hypothetical protein
MAHMPSDITAKVLIDLGLANNPGGSWPVYVGDQVDFPDTSINVLDRTGYSDGRVMNDGELQAHLGVQIIIRSATFPIGGAKMLALREALAESVYLRNVTLDGTNYLIQCFSRISQGIHLGKEEPESRRDIFTFDATLVITAL